MKNSLISRTTVAGIAAAEGRKKRTNVCALPKTIDRYTNMVIYA